MKAMILAAGLGTRLRPLTNDRPKALVEVAGHTLLEITIARLRQFGVREVIINAHHFSGLIMDYLKLKNNFNIRVEISREDALLDTGGGLKKASWFFLEDSRPASFILHNVDVISTIDLGLMLESHQQNKAMATLAVQQRETSRYLLFDEQMQLCGRRIIKEQKTEMVKPVEQPKELAFTGIHIISPRLLEMMSEDGVFSIIESYLRLAGQGEKILGYHAEGAYWRDLGKAENIKAAVQDLKDHAFKIDQAL
ncbi:MAG TPA: sugar phosphate nucleotidyltransferase [Candidatus Angelobacter sp.]|nr:sugar phosphate nucleotidyltransferase [Candidatus Angelobacter sp.]